MPTDWNYHADGVNTAVRTAHKLDGTLANVRIQIDGFRVREWSEDEAAESDRELFQEPDGSYTEHGGGAHATLRFTMDGSSAVLSSIEPEDSDKVKPRHMALLPAAERILLQIDGVQTFEPAIDTLSDAYEEAADAGIYIDALDA